MVESTQTTADDLRGAIEDALAAGVITRDEILDMVSTAEPTTALNGHEPAEPATARRRPAHLHRVAGEIDRPAESSD